MAVDAPRINGWLRLTIFVSGSNGIMQFPMDFKVVGDIPDVTALQSIAQQFWATNATTFKNLLNTAYNVDHILAETRYIGTNQQYDYIPLQPQAGVVTGDPSPSSASIVMTKKSGVIGRSFNGRCYLLGLSETDMIHDNVFSAYLVKALALANALLAFHSAPGVTSTWNNAVPSRKLLTLTTITSYIINNVLDSQRRRLTGRGS